MGGSVPSPEAEQLAPHQRNAQAVNVMDNALAFIGCGGGQSLSAATGSWHRAGAVAVNLYRPSTAIDTFSGPFPEPNPDTRYDAKCTDERRCSPEAPEDHRPGYRRLPT